MTTPQEADIRMALYHLRMAREFAKSAGAPKTTDAIRRAMKSAEGAQRHARGRKYREPEAERSERREASKAGKWHPTVATADSKCTACGALVENIIGCPDGAELCHQCFDAGRH